MLLLSVEMEKAQYCNSDHVRRYPYVFVLIPLHYHLGNESLVIL
jgi:hypothetical protein